jgi:hypothetical protein
MKHFDLYPLKLVPSRQYTVSQILSNVVLKVMTIINRQDKEISSAY